MPQNLDRRKGKGENPEWDQQSLALVAQHLTDSIFTSKGLFKALQDELLVNTKIRTEIQRDLQYLQNSVNEIAQVLMKGNGQKPLVGQVAALQTELTAMEKRIDDMRDHALHSAKELEKVEKRFEEGIEAVRQALAGQSKGFTDLLDEKLSALEDRLEERLRLREQTEQLQEEREERKRDRLWSLFVELAPHLLTWMALAGYVIHQWMSKNP